jgi:radical SAM protein with 4Fe4S-binding SPASM domain
VERAIGNGRCADQLSPRLQADLDRHGFFDGPRPPEEDTPSVQIQLTNECNLRCDYCCTNSGTPRRKELSFSSLSRVIEEITLALGDRSRVALLGGEPFMVPWAIDLAEQIVDRGLHLTIFTNATMFAKVALARRTAALIERGVEVRVSLAGATADLCNAVSGASRFERALRGVDQLARFGGRVSIDMMVIPAHVGALAQHLSELRRRLPPQTPVALGILYRSGRETGGHLFECRSALENALDRIAFEAGETISVPERSPVTHRREGCSCALGHQLHLRSDGGLFRCFKMEEQVGDLDTHDFLSVAHRMQAHPRPASQLHRCADCALATLCGGGCRSDNLLYTGDADQPVCGPWRPRVLCELLAEDRITAVDWPVHHLLAEAHYRGIEAPRTIDPVKASRHLIET